VLQNTEFKAKRKFEKTLDANPGKRRIRTPSQRPSVNGRWMKNRKMFMLATFFNNLNKKSVWTFTGIELFEIVFCSSECWQSKNYNSMQRWMFIVICTKTLSASVDKAIRIHWAETFGFQKNFNWRVWSWLRLNAGGRPNTCKSSGNTRELASEVTSGGRVSNA
jgi:hypothetical protein